MGENTKIEWADHTFNPWMGCSKVSEGCRNCYAENQMDHRWNKVQWGPGKARVRTSEAMWRKPLVWNAEAEKTGIRPRVFSLSLGDWLDPEVPIEWLADFLALIQRTPHLNWLLVTKRPELWARRMAHVFGFEMCENSGAERGRLQLAWDWFHGKDAPANVWLLTSVEDQEATKRIQHLLNIPAVIHGLSCEPLLGPVDLSSWIAKAVPYLTEQNFEAATARNPFVIDLDSINDQIVCNLGIDWVICGGESGAHARPMHPEWARSLRDQCQAAGVPFHFKQWGEWIDEGQAGDPMSPQRAKNTGSMTFLSDDGDVQMIRVGKKDAGRLLDGREWNELPEVAHV